MRSTVRPLPDGAVERWDPAVGRWRLERAAQPAAPSVQQPVQRRQVVLAAGGAMGGYVPPGAAGRQAARMYQGARGSRTSMGFGSSANTSADAQLQTSLRQLRSRSRELLRDSPYAKRAQALIVDNVVGTGVGLQAHVHNTRGGLAKAVNDAIESAWWLWMAAENCHTGGALHFHDLERAALGEVFAAGEVLIRLHARRFGSSRVPLALELIEAERLVSEYHPGPTDAANEVRMGVEVDSYGRPVAYWLRERHPGDITSRAPGAERVERVPAADIFHLRLTKRWPQTRGEPWMHAVLRKLDDMAEYTGLELTAARGSAAYFATITTPEPDNPLATSKERDASGEEDTERDVMDLEPLTVQALNPGEELQFHAPNRPNSAMDPFMRAMLREVAAGLGPSYESLSRDYSQSNYSSSRLALLDDRDGYRALQQWWIRSFREPLHRRWLQQAVLARAVDAVPVAAYAADPERYSEVLFKPRGWSWVDPTKEVAAYKEAVKAGFTTVSDVIAATANGKDLEDVLETRRRELDAMKEAGLSFDTDPASPAAAGMTAPAGAPGDGDEGAEDPEDEGGQPGASRTWRVMAGGRRSHA